MRIAQVIGTLEAGGAETLVRDLAVALRRRGHEVSVVLLDRFSYSLREQSSTHCLRRAGVSVGSLGRQPGWPGFTGACRLFQLCFQSRFDIVHSHLPLSDAVAGINAKLAPRWFAHVMTVHNTQEGRSRLVDWFTRGAVVVYCSNAAQAANRERLGPGHVVQNGIDFPALETTPESAEAIRVSLQLRPSSRLVVSVGSLTHRKNYHCAIQAIERLYRDDRLDVRYAICGEGPARDELLKTVSGRGLAGVVTLLSNRNDIPAILAAADCFLSASLAEGLPIAAIEALGTGVPVVLSLIPEHLELARGMEGCHFAAENNPSSMAEILSRVLMGSGAQSHAQLRTIRRASLEKYSIERCSEEYLQVYSRACNRQANAHWISDTEVIS